MTTGINLYTGIAQSCGSVITEDRFLVSLLIMSFEESLINSPALLYKRLM